MSGAQPLRSSASNDPSKKNDIAPFSRFDFGSRMGNGWTYAGTSKDGRLLFTQPAGNTTRPLILTREQFELTNAKPAATPRDQKVAFSPNQHLTLGSANRAKVAGYDSVNHRVLVQGRVNGEWVNQWVDANLVNSVAKSKVRGEKAQLDARTALLKGLGAEASTATEAPTVSLEDQLKKDFERTAEDARKRIGQVHSVEEAEELEQELLRGNGAFDISAENLRALSAREYSHVDQQRKELLGELRKKIGQANQNFAAQAKTAGEQRAANDNDEEGEKEGAKTSAASATGRPVDRARDRQIPQHLRHKNSLASNEEDFSENTDSALSTTEATQTSTKSDRPVDRAQDRPLPERLRQKISSRTRVTTLSEEDQTAALQEAEPYRTKQNVPITRESPKAEESLIDESETVFEEASEIKNSSVAVSSPTASTQNISSTLALLRTKAQESRTAHSGGGQTSRSFQASATTDPLWVSSAAAIGSLIPSIATIPISGSIGGSPDEAPLVQTIRKSISAASPQLHSTPAGTSTTVEYTFNTHAWQAAETQAKQAIQQLQDSADQLYLEQSKKLAEVAKLKESLRKLRQAVLQSTQAGVEELQLSADTLQQVEERQAELRSEADQLWQRGKFADDQKISIQKQVSQGRAEIALMDLVQESFPKGIPSVKAAQKIREGAIKRGFNADDAPSLRDSSARATTRVGIPAIPRRSLSVAQPNTNPEFKRLTPSPVVPLDIARWSNLNSDRSRESQDNMSGDARAQSMSTEGANQSGFSPLDLDGSNGSPASYIHGSEQEKDFAQRTQDMAHRRDMLLGASMGSGQGGGQSVSGQSPFEIGQRAGQTGFAPMASQRSGSIIPPGQINPDELNAQQDFLSDTANNIAGDEGEGATKAQKAAEKAKLDQQEKEFFARLIINVTGGAFDGVQLLWALAEVHLQLVKEHLGAPGFLKRHFPWFHLLLICLDFSCFLAIISMMLLPIIIVLGPALIGAAVINHVASAVQNATGH